MKRRSGRKVVTPMLRDDLLVQRNQVGEALWGKIPDSLGDIIRRRVDHGVLDITIREIWDGTDSSVMHQVKLACSIRTVVEGLTS